MKHYNIPIFISHFGCPNDCVFCNQKKINGRETDVTLEDVRDTIELYLKTLPKKSKKEVAFFGGTFTGISFELQKEYLGIVKGYIDRGLIDGIRVSTRPDYIDETIVDMLKSYGVSTVELGVQSLDEEVLRKSSRYYHPDVVAKACRIIKDRGITLGVQLMLGLPGADEKSDYESAQKAAAMNPDIARIYPTLVIKETYMAQMFREGTYIPLTLEAAVSRCKKIYSLLEYRGINVVRVGLQPTEELNDKENVLGGPFHPAFREMVEGEIYYDFLSRIVSKEEELKIEVNERNVSRVIGLNRINKIRFGNRFQLKMNSSLGIDEIVVNGKNYYRKEVLRGEIDEPDNNQCK